MYTSPLGNNFYLETVFRLCWRIVHLASLVDLRDLPKVSTQMREQLD
jgi:hypothetical protein